MTPPRDLRDPHLAALVERIPDDLFVFEPRPRRPSLAAWMRSVVDRRGGDRRRVSR
ncbi:MAG: hypothetical protein H6719_20425 [Sandaracinaceae bacterium]|nr:hypothetical protein [Sandaracinaceae bacterium]